MLVHVVVEGGGIRETETTELAMGAATSQAFREAMEQGGVVVLEPIMRFEIKTPSDYLKAVVSDLSARRGNITNLDSQREPVTLTGTVPLSEIFGYSTAIRSMSQGRASFSVEPSTYEPVPEEIARQLTF